MTPDWSTWLPASCYPTACFCEQVGAGFVRQPANTWSSLLFLIPAAAILLAGPRSGPMAPTARRYATALAIIGLGSGFFHASLTFAGQTMDVMGMYLLITLVIVTAAERQRLLDAGRATMLYWGSNLALLIALVTIPAARRYVFAVLAVGAVWLEWTGRPRSTPPASRYLLASVAALALGFVIWTLDISGTVCNPTSRWQGHAIWHGLAAVAAGCHFRYASSQRT